MDMQIAVFQALADPTRLQIVEAMKLGECAVGDIVERVEIQQSGVSRHLRILQDAGLVTVRPEGQRRIYALRPEPFAALDAWTREYSRLWDGRLDRMGAELPAEMRRSVISVTAPNPDQVTLRLAGRITVLWGDTGRAAAKARALTVLMRAHLHYYDVSAPGSVATR